jgi:Leucine-rich repeat (LRR) protein
LHKLQELFLDNNLLEIIPAELTNLNNLYALSLGGNKIDILPMEFEKIEGLGIYMEGDFYEQC